MPVGEGGAAKSGGPVARASVTGEAEATSLIDEVASTMLDLTGVLDLETAHLGAGRVREGLAQEKRKAELAAQYLRGLEAIKANAVALARFAPGRIATLKTEHEGFRAAVERNQAVVATARAVADGLVKSLADELAKMARPQTYGGGRSAPGPARPLSISKRL